jgi:hypothetical protein
VDRAPSSIPLQDKNTRSFGVGRVLLNHGGGLDTIYHLTGKDTVLGDLIVAVRRDPNLAGSDEIDDPGKESRSSSRRIRHVWPVKGERRGQRPTGEQRELPGPLHCELGRAP